VQQFKDLAQFGTTLKDHHSSEHLVGYAKASVAVTFRVSFLCFQISLLEYLTGEFANKNSTSGSLPQSVSNVGKKIKSFPSAPLGSYWSLCNKRQINKRKTEAH
jgi:hypothetical protein